MYKLQVILHFYLLLYHVGFIHGQNNLNTGYRNDRIKSGVGPISALTQFTGYIQREDLERMLHHEFQYHDTKTSNKTFLEQYSQFIVPYKWPANNNGSEKENMRQTLTLVADYNLKNRFIGAPLIRIMIDVSLRNSIDDDLNTFFEDFIEINLKFPGVVPKLLINYGFHRLGPNSLSVIHDDVTRCNAYVENRKGNITCGFILDINNCADSVNLLTQLPFSKNNLLILDLKEDTLEGFLNTYLLTLECIQTVTVTTEVEIGITFPTSVIVNTLTRTFNRHDYGRLINVHSVYVERIELVARGNSTPETNISGCHHHTVNYDWIRRPSKLNKQHMGVTLDSSIRIATPFVLPLLFESFHSIVLETHGGPSKVNLKRRQEIAIQMAFHVKKISQKDNSPMRITLSIPLFHEDWAINKVAVDEAMSTAMAVNQIHRGLVSGIVFEWTYCFKSEPCIPIQGSYTLREYMNKHHKVLKSVFSYALKYRNDLGMQQSLQLGLALEQRLIYHKNFLYNNWIQVVHGTLFKHVDFLMYKVTVDVNECYERGGFVVGQALTPKIFPLDHVLINYILPGNDSDPPVVAYKIKVVGCGALKRKKCVPGKLSELVEYIQFWEHINNWAELVNTTVIMDTSFEESNTSKTDKCRFERHPFKGPKGCACGWWIFTNVDRKGGNVTIVEKKAAALQIYTRDRIAVDQPPEAEAPLWKLFPYGVVALSLMIICIVVAAYLGRYHRRTIDSSTVLTMEDLKSFFKGGSADRVKLKIMLHVGNSGHAESQPYNKVKYELAPSSFQVGTTCLGKGEFGMVHLGSITRIEDDIVVAVKMGNHQRSTGQGTHGQYLALKGLISEIKILSYVGKHENIVKLEGAYTAKLRKGKLMVFLEYCELGSLQKYLANCRPTLAEGENFLTPELYNDLGRWGKQIAGGMEYLASKNVVHADLAARNILLTSQKLAKISDFGLSRRLYDYTEYHTTEQGPLPWRWMSPESLRKLIFNEKSDVWSFGVTLWEMYTLGDVPYPGLSCDVDFPTTLEVGIRLAKPKWNEGDMYTVMRKCWETVPEERPTFSQLYSMLSQQR